DELTRKAVTNNVNLSLSGGANNFTYHSSIGVDDQQGILRGNDLTRYSGRFNMTQLGLNDKLRVALNMAASRTENVRADARSMVGDMLLLNPTMPVYTNGQPTQFENKLSPIAREQIYSDNILNHRILANVT